MKAPQKGSQGSEQIEMIRKEHKLPGQPAREEAPAGENLTAAEGIQGQIGKDAVPGRQTPMGTKESMEQMGRDAVPGRKTPTGKKTSTEQTTQDGLSPAQTTISARKDSLQKTAGLRNAVLIGGVCSLAYLTAYLSRNSLGTVTPQMIEAGVFTTERIGTLSSLFFISYAFGQLINGAVGDRIHAKYMISLGLILAAVCSLVFTVFSASFQIACVSYGFTGFALSMLYGPMTKVVAENTEPAYTTRCCLSYTVASLLASPLAGLMAMALTWRGVFFAGSGALMAVGFICFAAFMVFEQKGIVRYNQYRQKKTQGAGIKALLRHQIVKYTFISMITGVVRTTVVFWMPTYFSQHLGFSAERSAFLFTVATLLISSSAFLAVFTYERLHENMNLTVLLAFIMAAVCFLIVYFLRAPLWNVAFLILAILGSNTAASVLWSCYCPRLRDTGMVSSATGFLDFASYMAASVSSTLFANAVSDIGWGGLILVWAGLMIFGVALCLPYPASVRPFRRPHTPSLRKRPAPFPPSAPGR